MRLETATAIMNVFKHDDFKSFGQLTLNQITEHSGLSKTTVVHALKELCERGIVFKVERGMYSDNKEVADKLVKLSEGILE